MKEVKTFIQTLKTAQLVALYNLVNPPEARVKKFADRATAEARLVKMIDKYPDNGYSDFFSDFAGQTAKLGFELPAPAPAPEPVKEVPQEEDKPAPKKGVRAERAKKSKEPSSPHVNLRCGSCDYYAKTTLVFLAKGRLVCPMNKAHGNLLTAEERGEKRGRS